jgi:3'(2'), 5'-bisphosphate nucleotidase
MFFTMDNTLIELIPDIIGIAARAGQAIMSVYESPDDVELQHKEDDTPVTRADHLANAIITQALLNLRPEWPVLSEEQELQPYALRQTWTHCWIVDPLDGTKEFIRRNGNFTVNIALAHQGTAILGVIYAPATGECFWAVEGAGAYELSAEGSQKLACTPFGWQDSGLRILSSRSHYNPDTAAFLRQFDLPEFLFRGSALKFGILARGEADVYVRMGPTSEWDTAAGQIILEEAGGHILDFDTRQALRYNKENILNPSFIAYGQAGMP